MRQAAVAEVFDVSWTCMSRLRITGNLAMKKSLFGTDGIRGVVNKYPITAELALKVGRAVGCLLQSDKHTPTILIGKDTRLSGYMIENALTAGLCSMGAHVLLVGPLPTPGVSYIMRSLRADGGIMISASHNLSQDNGIKFFGPDGFKISDAMEAEIERLVALPDADCVRPEADRVGTARRIDDAVGRYIEFVKASFPKKMRLDGLKIVCDCANGALYKVAPYALSELGAQVIPIADHPDGHNINRNCGAVHPEKMRAAVIENKAHLGIAFDGDGDRIVMADEEGGLLDGNGILAILGVDMLERNALAHNTVVATVMANIGLERALEPLGGRVERTNVGDRHVVALMREQGYLLGGESSGHIIMLEHNTTGDAMLAALRMLATLIRRDQPLSEFAKIYQPLPEAQTTVRVNGTCPTTDTLNRIQREGEESVNSGGRVIIRPSGTEPIIRIMVQHESIRKAQTLARHLSDKVGALPAS